MKSKKLFFIYIHQPFLYLIYQERNSTESFQQWNCYRKIIKKKKAKVTPSTLGYWKKKKIKSTKWLKDGLEVISFYYQGKFFSETAISLQIASVGTAGYTRTPARSCSC